MAAAAGMLLGRLGMLTDFGRGRVGRAVCQRLFVTSDLGAVDRGLGFVRVQVGLDPSQHRQRPHVVGGPLKVLLLVA
jgi:hypothetical protein